MKAPSAQETASPKRVLLGRIHGAFGVRGELKLESFTDPARGIFRYQPWILRTPQGAERELEGARGRETAKGIGNARAASGYVVNREAGGANTLALQVLGDSWLCRFCLADRRRGRAWAGRLQVLLVGSRL